MGLSSVDAAEVIRRKLINKFKNTRRRHQNETAPQLLKDEKRRRLKDAKDSGLPMYSPSTPDMQPLKTECLIKSLKSLEPSNPETARIMDELFTERRRRLLAKKGRRPMQEIKESFPALFTADGVWSEMAKITANPDTKKECEDALGRVLTAVSESLRPGGSVPEDEALDALLNSFDVPWSLLTQERPAIYVRGDGARWEVVCEEVVVAEAATKKNAVLLQAISMYVFGQHMTTCTKPLNMFLEKAVLKLNTGTYIPARTRDVMKELKVADM